MLLLFLFEFTFYEADKKYKNSMNDQRSNHNHRVTLIFVVSLLVVRAEIGDRTTATESKLSVRVSVLQILAPVPFKRPTNYTNFTYSRVILHAFLFTVWVLLFYSWYNCLCRAENNGERERESKAPFQKRPYMYAYSTVMPNAFPLLTIDKKLSLEVTPKLERMEYSYKCCIDKEEAIVVCKK